MASEQTQRPVPLLAAWVAAKVETVVGPISSVALYGLMDQLSDASVHRSLSEVSPVLDDPSYKKLVILGGDLNTGTQWPKNDAFYRRDRNVLDRIEALGLIDCLGGGSPWQRDR